MFHIVKQMLLVALNLYSNSQMMSFKVTSKTFLLNKDSGSFSAMVEHYS